MKSKSLLFIASFFLLLAGCTKKADEIFDRSPDERLSDALAAYKQTLVSATDGWKVYVFPKGLEKSDDMQVGGFSYYMKFTDANRVTMYSDFDTTVAETANESGYRLKAAQRPSIYFDTYSSIHLPADPNSAISQSPTGSNGFGWGTDFEFAFTDEKLSTDTIHLRGNQNNSIALMVKASKAEADAFNAKQLKASIKNLKSLNAIGYFRRMTLGGKSYYLAINEGDKTITFNWLDGSGNVLSYTTGYLSTLTGLLFTVPFVDGTLVIPGINFTNFDAANNSFSITVNGTAGTVNNAGVPLKLDRDAPKRWYQYSADRASWWTSFGGFTVNGVADALKMRTIPNFYAYIFYAKYNVAYDAFSIFTLSGNSLSLFGPAISTPPTFTTDGRIVFGAYLGSFGTPAGATAAQINNYRALINDPNGYYLIQTGALSYDMVSKDGKAYIKWEW